jgi:hypothetical protein
LHCPELSVPMIPEAAPAIGNTAVGKEAPHEASTDRSILHALYPAVWSYTIPLLLQAATPDPPLSPSPVEE